MISYVYVFYDLDFYHQNFDYHIYLWICNNDFNFVSSEDSAYFFRGVLIGFIT